MFLNIVFIKMLWRIFVINLPILSVIHAFAKKYATQLSLHLI